MTELWSSRVTKGPATRARHLVAMAMWSALLLEQNGQESYSLGI